MFFKICSALGHLASPAFDEIERQASLVSEWREIFVATGNEFSVDTLPIGRWRARRRRLRKRYVRPAAECRPKCVVPCLTAESYTASGQLTVVCQVGTGVSRVDEPANIVALPASSDFKPWLDPFAQLALSAPSPLPPSGYPPSWVQDVEPSETTTALHANPKSERSLTDSDDVSFVDSRDVETAQADTAERRATKNTDAVTPATSDEILHDETPAGNTEKVVVSSNVADPTDKADSVTSSQPRTQPSLAPQSAVRVEESGNRVADPSGDSPTMSGVSRSNQADVTDRINESTSFDQDVSEVVDELFFDDQAVAPEPSGDDPDSGAVEASSVEVPGPEVSESTAIADSAPAVTGVDVSHQPIEPFDRSVPAPTMLDATNTQAPVPDQQVDGNHTPHPTGTETADEGPDHPTPPDPQADRIAQRHPLAPEPQVDDMELAEDSASQQVSQSVDRESSSRSEQVEPATPVRDQVATVSRAATAGTSARGTDSLSWWWLLLPLLLAFAFLVYRKRRKSRVDAIAFEEDRVSDPMSDSDATTTQLLAAQLDGNRSMPVQPGSQTPPTEVLRDKPSTKTIAAASVPTFAVAAESNGDEKIPRAESNAPNQLRSRIDALERQANALEEEKQQVSRQLEDYRSKVHKLETMINDSTTGHRKQLDALAAERDEAVKLGESYKQSLDDHARQQTVADKRLKDKEQQLIKHDTAAKQASIENEGLRVKIERYAADKTRLETSLRAGQTRTAAAEAKVERLQASLDSRDIELSALRSDHEASTKQIATFMGVVDTTALEKRRLADELQGERARLTTLESQLQSAQAELASRDALLSSQRSEHASAVVEIGTLTRAVETATAEQRRLSDELTGERARLLAFQSQVQELRTELSGRDSELFSLRLEQTTSKKKIATFIDTVDTTLGEQRQLSEELASERKRSAALASNVNRLQDDQARREAEMHVVVAERDRFASQIQTLHAERSEHDACLARRAADIAELKGQLVQQSAAQEALQTERDSLAVQSKERLTAAEAETASLRRAIAELNAAKSNDEQRVLALRSELTALKLRSDATTAEHSDLDGRNRKLTRELSLIKNEKQTLTEKIEQLANSWGEDRRNFESQLVSSLNQNETLLRQRDMTKVDLDESRAGEQTLREKIDALEKQNRELLPAVDDARATVQRLKNEVVDSYARVDQLETSIREQSEQHQTQQKDAAKRKADAVAAVGREAASEKRSLAREVNKLQVAMRKSGVAIEKLQLRSTKQQQQLAQSIAERKELLAEVRRLKAAQQSATREQAKMAKRLVKSERQVERADATARRVQERYEAKLAAATQRLDAAKRDASTRIADDSSPQKGVAPQRPKKTIKKKRSTDRAGTGSVMTRKKQPAKKQVKPKSVAARSAKAKGSTERKARHQSKRRKGTERASAITAKTVTQTSSKAVAKKTPTAKASVKRRRAQTSTAEQTATPKSSTRKGSKKTPAPKRGAKKRVLKKGATAPPKAKSKPTTVKRISKRAGAKQTVAKRDRLTLVEGIGPKVQGLLGKAGITTFAQLGRASQPKLKKLLEQAGRPYRTMNPATWSAQAKLAAKGQWDELKRWQSELHGGTEPK